ncbi:MAG: patatin-like phospholipase family protein, partial [Bacilli bacterium]
MTKYANGVFEGGGVKSIGLVGAAEIVEAKGYTWHSVAGSSGGAIVAAFLAAGYRSEDIYHLLQETSFRNFLKGNSFITKVPYIGPGLRFVTKNGLFTGDPIESWIRSKLTAKGVKRFRDLKIQLKVTV